MGRTDDCFPHMATSVVPVDTIRAGTHRVGIHVSSSLIFHVLSPTYVVFSAIWCFSQVFGENRKQQQSLLLFVESS